MSRRYVTAYVLWFAFVASAAMVALAWYKHVEQIGLEELRSRLRTDDEEREPEEV